MTALEGRRLKPMMAKNYEKVIIRSTRICFRSRHDLPQAVKSQAITTFAYSILQSLLFIGRLNAFVYKKKNHPY